MYNAACIDEAMDSVLIGMCIFSESIDISDVDDDSALKVCLQTRVQMNSTKESQHTIYRSVSDVDSRSVDSALHFSSDFNFFSLSFFTELASSLTPTSLPFIFTGLLLLLLVVLLFQRLTLDPFFLLISPSAFSSFSFNWQSGKGCSLISAYPCTIKRDNS